MTSPVSGRELRAVLSPVELAVLSAVGAVGQDVETLWVYLRPMDMSVGEDGGLHVFRTQKGLSREEIERTLRLLRIKLGADHGPEAAPTAEAGW